MGPTNSGDNRWRRFAHVLDPAPKYELKADAEQVNADNQIDDLALVCVDGSWIPEVELLRRGFEVVRTEACSEINCTIDTVLKRDSDRQHRDHARLNSRDRTE